MKKDMLITVIEDKPEEQQRVLDAFREAFPKREEVAYYHLSGGPPALALGPMGDAGSVIFCADNVFYGYEKIAFAQEATEITDTFLTGVLTDLMLPQKGFPDITKKPEKEEQPWGLEVVVECIQKGIPVAVCSDTDHHDVGYLLRLFPLLAQTHPAGNIPIVLDKKDWVSAIRKLVGVMNQGNTTP